MNKTITLLIDPTGKVTIEGAGFVGKECDAKMKAFEDAIGKVETRTDLPEYHQQAAVIQKVGQ